MSKNIEAKLDDLVQNGVTKEELAEAVKTITDNILALSAVVSKLDLGSKRSPSGGKSADVVVKGAEPDPSAAKRAAVPMAPTKPVWLRESCKFTADDNNGNTKSRDKRLNSFGMDKSAIAEATEKVNASTKNASQTGARWQEAFYKECVRFIESRKGTPEINKFKQEFETHVSSVTAQAKESNFTPVDSTSNKKVSKSAKADDSDDDDTPPPKKNSSDSGKGGKNAKPAKADSDDSDADDEPAAKPAKGGKAAAKPVKGGKAAAKADSDDDGSDADDEPAPKKGGKK